jgi:hypothetical protein
VTPRAKREAQRRERPGVPSLRAGALGARRVALEPRRRGAVGAGQPARTGGGEAPWGMPASCRGGRRDGMARAAGLASRRQIFRPGAVFDTLKFFDTPKSDQLAGGPARPTPSRGPWGGWWRATQERHPGAPVAVDVDI